MAEINVTQREPVVLVEVNGRVDSSNANELGEALMELIDGGHRHLVVNLTGVDYMSSAGLRELVSPLKRVRRENGDIRLVQPSPRVREVLELTGLDTIFQIYESSPEALDSY